MTATEAKRLWAEACERAEAGANPVMERVADALMKVVLAELPPFPPRLGEPEGEDE